MKDQFTQKAGMSTGDKALLGFTAGLGLCYAGLQLASPLTLKIGLGVMAVSLGAAVFSSYKPPQSPYGMQHG